jgi:hypothetical protein
MLIRLRQGEKGQFWTKIGRSLGAQKSYGSGKYEKSFHTLFTLKMALFPTVIFFSVNCG